MEQSGWRGELVQCHCTMPLTQQIATTTQWVAHEGHSISAIGVMSSGPLADVVVTGASDGLLKVWKVAGGRAELVQQLDFHGKLPLDIEVAYLPGSSSKSNCEWTNSSTYPRARSHRPAYTGLHIRRVPLHPRHHARRSRRLDPMSRHDTVPDLLLASGSQDNFIRLWRISAIAQSSGVATPATNGDDPLSMLDEFERKLAGEAGGSTQISTKAHVLAVEDGGR